MNAWVQFVLFIEILFKLQKNGITTGTVDCWKKIELFKLHDGIEFDWNFVENTWINHYQEFP